MRVKTQFIAEKMAQRGLNQSELAEKAGVSRQTIGAMLSNGRIPRTSKLMLIAKALRVNIDDIVDFNEAHEAIIRNTVPLREAIKSKMTELNIKDAEALCREIGYDKVETIQKLLAGELSWFPDVLSSVLQALDIEDAPVSQREKTLLIPYKVFKVDGAMLVRPVPVVSWANASSSITNFFSSENCIAEKWDSEEVETIIVPAGKREISLAFKVNGVSMEPTLYDDDIILVERKMNFSEIPDKKVVIVKFGDSSPHPGVFCKRLRRFGDVIRLTSDNPVGDEFEITSQNICDIEYLGQVVKVQSDRGL